MTKSYRHIIKYLLIGILMLIGTAPVNAAPNSAAAQDDKFVIVLDPGHGGKDYGAIGRITNEKTINLDVARRVKKLLGSHDDIKTVMTRDNDSFISLQERADIANKAHGDLFISIHVNSLARRARNRNTIAGASVYSLGLHRSSENLDVAMRENSVMSLEPDHTARYMGFDPTSTESYIIFELNQNKHMDQSITFAQMVQDQLTTTASRQDRGVRQAGFWVLMATAMPAVLVELDFICNPQMERYLNSSAGKNKLAMSIYKAICNYRGTDEQSPTSGNDTDKSGEQAEETPQTPDRSLTEGDTADVVQSDTAITYKIQILANDKPLSTRSAQFKGCRNVTFYKEKGLYKYTVGSYDTFEEAQNNMKKYRKKFPQAFVIKWQGDHRVH